MSTSDTYYVVMPYLFALVMVSAIACGLLTVGVIYYARRRGMLDLPDARRSHVLPTPRGGGLAMVLVVGGWLAVFAAMRLSLEAIALPVGLGLVAFVGWLDDHKHLAIKFRLAAHVLAAALLALALGTDPLQRVLIFCFTVVLINVWNFMDGINGIATTQAAVFAATAMLLHVPPGPALIALVLLGACIGFLPFNFPKARIFMGDVGSGSLGYLIALLWASADASFSIPFNKWSLLFPLAPFLVDASWTLARRVMKGEQWWTAHVTHLYQVWAKRLGNHTPVTLTYLAVSLAGATLAVCTAFSPSDFIKISLFVWYTVLSVGWWFLRKQGLAQPF